MQRIKCMESRNGSYSLEIRILKEKWDFSANFAFTCPTARSHRHPIVLLCVLIKCNHVFYFATVIYFDCALCSMASIRAFSILCHLSQMWQRRWRRKGNLPLILFLWLLDALLPIVCSTDNARCIQLKLTIAKQALTFWEKHEILQCLLWNFGFRYTHRYFP